MCKDSFVLLEFESDRHKIARTFEIVYFLKEKKHQKEKTTKRERKKNKNWSLKYAKCFVAGTGKESEL